jgi:hypothetical protein
MKRLLLEAAIGKGYNPILIIDTTVKSSIFPITYLLENNKMINNRYVPIQIGHTLKVPITDLYINDISWGGTLLFGGKPHFCSSALDSICQMETDEMVVVWRKNSEDFLEEPEPEPEQPKPKLKSNKPSHLRVVK